MLKPTSLVYLGIEEVHALGGDGPGKVYGWMTGVESVQEVLKGLPRIRPYTEDVVNVASPEGGLDGLVLKKARLYGIHEEIRIGGGHLGAHGCALYLLVGVCMEGKYITFEDYVKEGL